MYTGTFNIVGTINQHTWNSGLIY